jgi:hypothetical protein
MKYYTKEIARGQILMDFNLIAMKLTWNVLSKEITRTCDHTGDYLENRLKETRV